MKIVFMGTPDFAVPSLKILLDNGYDIVGVITATDKWGGRGNKKLLQSAVKRYAVEQNLRVLQPSNLKHPDFIKELAALKADLQVVVAFRMLPEAVWAMPPLGTINLHGSLLPKYRGAAPINWAIIQGEKQTGVTTFLLKHKIDTGDIIFQKTIPIEENDTAGTLHDKMMDIGAQVVLDTVRAIENGNYTPQPQSDAKATKAPKIFHRDCQIDFHQKAQKVHDFIRGLSPYPTAWTLLNGQKLKIFKTTKETAPHTILPGNFVTDNKKYLKFATEDGYVNILECQLEGRKRLNIRDFLNGITPKYTAMIGITGGIGSGKTTVCKIFETLNIPVYYADTAAKKLMTSDIQLIQAIKALLGEEAYTNDNRLNKPYIAGKIFSDKHLLEAINKIVHPVVYRDYVQWHLRQAEVPYTLFEAAILFDSEHFGHFDKTITVFAPQKARIKRIRQRDKLPIAAIKNRMKSQIPEREKIKLADFVIKNNERHSLIKQVLTIHRQLSRDDEPTPKSITAINSQILFRR